MQSRRCSHALRHPPRRRSLSTSFNYIVVGAGSAGAAVASRLSEDPSRSVLLLEAGKDINPLFRVPLLSVVYGVLVSREYNWRYYSEPEPHLGGRCIYQPRGRITGGSSSINGMIWVRGHPEDYNDWARATEDDRWAYANLIDAFRKSEDASTLSAERSADRGYGGEMRIGENGWVHPLSAAFVAAAQEACGLPLTPSFNTGVNTHGVGVYELNQHQGERWGTARAYLSDEVRARPNLQLLPQATALRVLFDTASDGGAPAARGVEFLRRGGDIGVAHALSEVVLAGGVFNTPQLLMLSGALLLRAPPGACCAVRVVVDDRGCACTHACMMRALMYVTARISSATPRHAWRCTGIGPADELTAHGLKVLVDSPGVGKQLHDHLDVGVSVSNPSGEALGLSARALPSLLV